MIDDVVIVGASVAGVRTAEALRRRGFGGRVTLIGAEPRPPYDRPPLSKAFLAGRATEDDLPLLDGDRLDRLELDLRLGVRAAALDPPARMVRLASGEPVPFGTAVIATGSVPRRLPALDGRPGVHVLRTLDDAIAIRAALTAGARVAVVGGGFIGAEVASCARALGRDVTIIDPVPAMMARGLGPVLGQVLAGRHADHGVVLRLGRSVVRAEGTGRVERLLLDDGTTVDADLVVVGVGADPAVDWLAGSGLAVDGGLCCDACLRARGADAVYGVGDVARWPSARYRGPLRLEHWTNAGEAALAVAAAITGAPAPFDPLPYVWSDQLGVRVQVFGQVGPRDEVVYVEGGPDTAEFVAAAGCDGALHAVVAVGARRAALRWERILRSGATWTDGSGPAEPRP
ncbi:MAG TPA: FAD-dependent oxidoreductase [Streptosporangiaceae bacterium]|nr:FAD-dependent oxidoreductase [Streptosporangiaceae bacterium]